MMEAPLRKIILRPAEQLLREMLLDCAQNFPGIEIWIAGGWVRDRLLGIPSSDLDFALSTVTGREFGKFLRQYSSTPVVASRYQRKATDLGISDSMFTRFHIVERNVGMSKHLETAGGKLFGLDIDLVNLRKEVYDGKSRTPEMSFGTPEEDALRRDATVNSLFFHLERQEVVDLTGRGLKDLQAKIMSTPLEPRQTFLDDPLRVLRLIRIGSKLGFTIDPAVLSCMKTEEIRRALDKMITRDRIRVELFKIMEDQGAAVAFQYLFESNLYVPIFVRLDSALLQTLQAGLPTLEPPTSTAWLRMWPRSYRLLDYLLEDKSKLGMLVRSPEDVQLWSMAAYAPLAKLRATMLPQVVQEATDAIKSPTKISKLLESALKNFDSIRGVVKAVAAPHEERPSRSHVGMALRSWGPTWNAQVVYVMLAEALSPKEDLPPSNAPLHDSCLDEPDIKALVARYSTFANYIWSNGLQDAHAQRPLLDGTQILALFGLSKGGTFVKTAMEELMAWQLDHRECGVEDAKAWLLEQRERLACPTKLE